MVHGDPRGSSLNALRDIEIALDLGRSTTTAMPVSSIVASMLRLVVAQGHTTPGMAGPLRLYTSGSLTEVAAQAAGSRREGGE